MAYGTINADVIQSSVTGVSLGAGNATVFKNRIINGSATIDQRNAGAAVANNTSGSQYTLDRWLAYGTAASKFNIQQSTTAPAGFSNSILITSTAATSVGASDVYEILQKIEGFNFSDMAWGTANAKTITLSFQVYSSLTGTFGGAIQNSANSRSYPFNYTISSANTWTSISITVPGDTSGTWIGATNGIGAQVVFGLGVGSTFSSTANTWATGNYVSTTGATSVVGTSGATFYITGVQLEVGSSATGFEYVNYGAQLLMCQRYYQTATATYAGSAVSTANNGCMGQFLQTMRTAPTVAWVSNSGSLNFPTSALTSYYLSTTTQNFFPFRAATGTGQDSRYTDNYTASAEL